MKGIKFANYGQERGVNATPEELQIAEWIMNEYPDDNMRLVRVSDSYVTVKRGEWDIVRLKYTKRAKWLMFPSVEMKQVKHYTETPEEVENYKAIIKESVDTAKRFE